MNKNITREKLANVAKLSKLEFTEQELEKMQLALVPVVDYLSQLKDIDNTKFEMNFNNNNENTMREDYEQVGLTKTDVVKNAPRHNENSFIVPRVVE